MFTKNHYINIISLILIITIGLFFLLLFFNRSPGHPFIISAQYFIPFINMVLMTGVIFLCEKYGNPDKINAGFIFSAVLSGFAFSTVSVTALIYVIYYLYYFRNNLKYFFVFAIISLAVFALLQLLFIIWDKGSFIKNDPLLMPSFFSYLPVWIMVLIILISIYIGWAVAGLQEVFFACGVMLFTTVFLSMIYKISAAGFFNAVPGDIFDLLYYSLALPFLILSVKQYKVDRFLGKVLNT